MHNSTGVLRVGIAIKVRVFVFTFRWQDSFALPLPVQIILPEPVTLPLRLARWGIVVNLLLTFTSGKEVT